MAADFPPNPLLGQVVISGSASRKWDGTAWISTRNESAYLRNIDGGSSTSVYMQNIDGGNANSVYTSNQIINGGTAGTF